MVERLVDDMLETSESEAETFGDRRQLRKKQKRLYYTKIFF